MGSSTALPTSKKVCIASSQILPLHQHYLHDLGLNLLPEMTRPYIKPCLHDLGAVVWLPVGCSDGVQSVSRLHSVRVAAVWVAAALQHLAAARSWCGGLDRSGRSCLQGILAPHDHCYSGRPFIHFIFIPAARLATYSLTYVVTLLNYSLYGALLLQCVADAVACKTHTCNDDKGAARA